MIHNNSKSPKLEMKTIKKDKFTVLLSSVAGWELKEPKILVVLELEKVSGKRPKREGIKNKSLDIGGKFYKYTIYKFNTTDKILFPSYKNVIDLSKLTTSNLKKDKDEYEKYKTIVKRINSSNRDLPISLSLMLNKGGNGRLYYNIRSLKNKKLQDLICNDVKCFNELEKYKNISIQLYKDYTNIDGPKGYYDQKMIDWEYENTEKIQKSTQPNIENNKKKNKRYLGDIYINNQLWKKNYKKSRQDFWLGFVFEDLAEENNPLIKKTDNNTIGQDFSYILPQKIPEIIVQEILEIIVNEVDRPQKIPQINYCVYCDRKYKQYKSHLTTKKHKYNKSYYDLMDID